jgi:hypothetical protein
MKLYTPQLLLNTYLLCSIENSCWICKEVWGQVFEDFVVRIKSWLLSRGSAQSTFLSLCTTGTKSSIKQIQNRLHSWSGKHNRNMLNFSSQKKKYPYIDPLLIAALAVELNSGQLSVLNNFNWLWLSPRDFAIWDPIPSHIIVANDANKPKPAPWRKTKKKIIAIINYQLRHRRNLR